MRWGVVGTGGIAASFAGDLNFSDSGRVVAVGSRHRSSADRFADRFDIPVRHVSYQARIKVGYKRDIDATHLQFARQMHFRILRHIYDFPAHCGEPF